LYPASGSREINRAPREAQQDPLNTETRNAGE
jgi:hypothetical protein